MAKRERMVEWTAGQWLPTAEVDAKRNLINRKPYRTKEMKAEARRLARRCEDGAWRSSAPFLVRDRVSSN